MTQEKLFLEEGRKEALRRQDVEPLSIKAELLGWETVGKKLAGLERLEGRP